jgi:uncharacterized coiled-coil DUF342 family protein
VIDVQAVAEQIAQERDAAEREAREKETRVLSLTREIDEMNEKVEELERGRRQLQAELDELVNNQGTADKNVSTECLGYFLVKSDTVIFIVALCSMTSH